MTPKKVDPNAALCYPINIRLARADRDTLDELARKWGISRSDAFRHLLANAWAVELQDAAQTEAYRRMQEVGK